MSSPGRPRPESGGPIAEESAAMPEPTLVPFPAQRPDRRPDLLPLPLTSLIGRDRDIEAVNRALDANRLVTLIGTGGVGKTRLALQVASTRQSTHPDGVRL